MDNEDSDLESADNFPDNAGCDLDSEEKDLETVDKDLDKTENTTDASIYDPGTDSDNPQSTCCNYDSCFIYLDQVSTCFERDWGF